jgi:hypothetical protein
MKMKKILATFTIAIISCLVLSVSASAEDWAAGGGDYNADTTITVTNESSGKITVTECAVTITGTAVLSNPLEIETSSGGSVIWQANVTGSGKVTFSGAGNATITGSITSTDATFDSGAVETSSNLSVINSTISGGFAGIKANDGGTITISGANTYIQGGRYGLLILAGSTVNITGGTFSGTGEENSLGIERYTGPDNATCTVSPASGTPVLTKGNYIAFSDHNLLDNVMYYTESENYDGSDAITKKTADEAYSFNRNNKYLIFYAEAPSFNVNVIGGTANGSTSAAIQAETEVSIIPTPGEVFIRWDSTGVVLTDPTTANQTFSMPLNDVTLTAVFEIPSEPEPTPKRKPSRPSKPSSYSPPRAPVYNPGDTQEYKTKSGITAKVTVTETGVEVEAGLNKSGSVNSEATAAAVSKAAEIARLSGEKTVTIDLPEGTIGLSKSTVQKLIDAAGDTEVVVNITTVIDGETVGSISVPLTSETGQILTGLSFESESINSAQDYIKNKWETDILGSFETAQKGGWGDTATLSVSMDKLGFSAEDGTSLYAIIYDTKTGIMYQVPAVIVGDEVVVETKRTGLLR